ncbi:hypothetical protein Ancab_025083 [Ancistrocladus abbreviatus]
MESTAVESADGKSDGGLVGLGEKREFEDGNAEELVIQRKKMRNGGFESEKEMRRVAEIVLVLSAMGRMRGGKHDPTEAEKAMMAEAREKVVAICEELAPKDIMPMEAFGGVIEDLGLNRLKEQQRLGFRGPKLSILDKMELAKRRMGESKVFASQAASYPSQQLQTAAAAAGDNRSKPLNAHMLPSNKPGRVPVSTTSFRPPTPAGHVPSTTSAPLPFQPRTSEVRPMVHTGLANSNLGKDFPSGAPPRVEGTHYRSDARPNGPSFAPHLPANQQVVKPVGSPFQPLSASPANMVTKTKLPDHPQIKLEGNASVSAPQITPQVANVQTTIPVIPQTAPTTVSGMHHPIQSLHFVHTAPIFNHHLEISKIVQKLLYPKLPEPPSWIPPSRDYMNKALTCQMCKSVINEVEGVLVCDACEKGFHLRCLESLVHKGIPRGEWHCHRCLSISNGKPFPPKYGRVTRNTNSPKFLSNVAGAQSSSEKKVVTVDQKVNQPNVVTNGNSDGKKPPHTGLTAESTSESKLSHGNDASLDHKKDDWPNSETCSNDAAGIIGTTCTPRPSGSLNDTHGQLELKSESFPPEDSVTEAQFEIPAKSPIASTSDHPRGSNNHDDVGRTEERLVAETWSQTLAKPSPVTSASDQQQGSSDCNEIDHRRASDGIDTELRQQGDCNKLIVCMEKSDACETICCNPNSNVNQDDQNASQENNVERVRVRMEGEPSGASEDRLHNVEWTSDVHRVVDGKKFYQSCSVDGLVYKVHNYALFHLGNAKLIPSKLEAMWEDTKTNSKWVMVNRCYFPADLPDSVGHPCAPESNEVYDSNDNLTLMAGLIEGPCEVLVAKTFGEDDRGTQVNDRRWPIFQCKWFYDKVKGVFRPIPS